MEDEYIQKRFYNELPGIHEICQRCGFTIQDLAIKMGVSTMTVYRWFDGAHIPLERRILLRETLDRYGRK